jgi:hypothetical protein
MKWYDYLMWRGSDDVLFPVILFLLVAYFAVAIVGAIFYLWRILK